jgi:hypothetical protein
MPAVGCAAERRLGDAQLAAKDTCIASNAFLCMKSCARYRPYVLRDWRIEMDHIGQRRISLVAGLGVPQA